MTVTYIYENEAFAKKIFENLKKKYRRTTKILRWYDGGDKRIETADIVFKFIHYTKLNETYRGHKNTLIFFEPSLVNVMTDEQLFVARISFMRYGIEQNCLSLEETIEIFRGNKRHELQSV